jgi:arsenate reductase (glutaredoxin)
MDTQSRAYRDAGLAYLRMDETEVLDRLPADPGLLRLPLVRSGAYLSVGPDESSWRAWLASNYGSATRPT